MRCPAGGRGSDRAGYYRSTDSGATWTDSLLPGYATDSSPQAATLPLHQSVLAGALADGDPSMAFDGEGRLFYLTSNFSRGHLDGDSPFVTGMTGELFMSTYGPSDPSDPSTGAVQLGGVGRSVTPGLIVSAGERRVLRDPLRNITIWPGRL